MKLDAVGVTSSNFQKTIEFYETLGFRFQKYKEEDAHVETVPNETGIKFMIDSRALAKELLGESPKPGNTSCFAIQYDTPLEIDGICSKLKQANFKIEKKPWDVFWGQRYAVVQDPDGYKVDLYATL